MTKYKLDNVGIDFFVDFEELIVIMDTNSIETLVSLVEKDIFEYFHGDVIYDFSIAIQNKFDLELTDLLNIEELFSEVCVRNNIKFFHNFSTHDTKIDVDKIVLCLEFSDLCDLNFIAN